MSYNFSQFRRTQLDSYSTALTTETGTQEFSANISDGSVVFYNACQNLSGDNVVNSQNAYYLRFGVRQRTDSQQDFYLKLKNVTQTEDNEQTVEEYHVPRGSEITYFEVIIAPNATYNQFLFELQRTALDYRMLNSDGTYGRVMTVYVAQYTRLVNLISYLATVRTPGMTALTKIGVQGPYGLLMAINRQQIRIGRSGIYQLNNGVSITSLSFVPKKTLDGFAHKDEINEYSSQSAFPTTGTAGVYYYDKAAGLVYEWKETTTTTTTDGTTSTTTIGAYEVCYDATEYFIMDFEY